MCLRVASGQKRCFIQAIIESCSYKVQRPLITERTPFDVNANLLSTTFPFTFPMFHTISLFHISGIAARSKNDSDSSALIKVNTLDLCEQ